MKDADFEFDNIWHATPHLLYGFCCHDCGATLGVEQVLAGDLGEGLQTYCVAVAKEAQHQGWVYAGDLKFRCPRCASAELPLRKRRRHPGQN